MAEKDRPGFQYATLQVGDPKKVDPSFKNSLDGALQVYGNNILWLAQMADSLQVSVAELKSKSAPNSVAAAAGKSSGTYLPEAIAGVNVSEAVATLAGWFRVDDMVVVSGVLIVTPTAPGACNTDIPLPIPSKFVDLVQASGTINQQGGPDAGTMLGNILTFNVNAEWEATSTGPYNMGYIYRYQIIR